MPSANKVADYFISRSREYGDYLTNLKLQKLLYYSQGWYLGLTGKPLFPDVNDKIGDPRKPVL